MTFSGMPDSLSTVLPKMLMSVVVCIVTSIVASLVSEKLPSLADEVESFLDGVSATEPHKLRGKALTSYERQLLPAMADGSAIQETLDDVGGLSLLKEELRATVVAPLQNPSLFFDPRIRSIDTPRGVLLCGPPGTGKTMIARALARESSASFLAITLSMLENKYYGETGKLIQATFSLAHKLQPTIIFFDEIDGMLKERRSDDQNCSYTFKTELLSQMDGFNKQPGSAVLVIACTNAADRLDPAVRRRLPKCVEIGLPDEPARRQILGLVMKDEQNHRIRSERVRRLAVTTEGFSGSDLHDLYRTAAANRSQRLMRSGSDFLKHVPRAPMTDAQVAALLKRVPSLTDDDWEHARRRIKQKMPNHLAGAESQSTPDSEKLLSTLRQMVSKA